MRFGISDFTKLHSIQAQVSKGGPCTLGLVPPYHQCLNQEQRHEGGGRPGGEAGVLVGVGGAAEELLQAGGESEFDEDFTWPIFIPICFK